MRISKITLQNFRVYKDLTVVDFKEVDEKNVYLIAGKNGFGKTTFLTSLIWGFYGKLMSQVESKYQKDIKKSGGYENYLKTLINNESRNSSEDEMLVEIELDQVQIPSLPCETITIQRKVSISTNSETLNLMIDGIPNQLTKDVGYDVFINDFILPREIAKFFFFDAEKIVELAEASTIEDYRELNKAYSAVLGIKKYEDLRINLDALIKKLMKSAITDSSDQILVDLSSQKEDIEAKINFFNNQICKLDNELSSLRQESDDLQEKLIREGNSISLEELKELKKTRNQHENNLIGIKEKIVSFMDIAPLAVAGKKLKKLKDQLDLENKPDNDNEIDLSFHMSQYSDSVIELLKNNKELSAVHLKMVKNAFKKVTIDLLSSDHSINESFLNFSKEIKAEFDAIYRNLKDSFLLQLNDIVTQKESEEFFLNKVAKRIKEAEARQNNALAKSYRLERESIMEQISSKSKEKQGLILDRIETQSKLASISEKLDSKLEVLNSNKIDQKKLDTTKELKVKVEKLIEQIKDQKKYSLQNSIQQGINSLMHKKDFVSRVEVSVKDDILEIHLYDSQDRVIHKDNLSKGEQQLYATALLKALVKESGIEFPIFIDSPLQKFDNQHSSNVIENFYPKISKQLILFPLLGKELSYYEYVQLKPMIAEVYVINNQNNASTIIKQEVTKSNFEKSHVFAN